MGPLYLFKNRVVRTIFVTKRGTGHPVCMREIRNADKILV
jgi:hypothetical protein